MVSVSTNWLPLTDALSINLKTREEIIITTTRVKRIGQNAIIKWTTAIIAFITKAFIFAIRFVAFFTFSPVFFICFLKFWIASFARCGAFFSCPTLLIAFFPTLVALLPTSLTLLDKSDDKSSMSVESETEATFFILLLPPLNFVPFNKGFSFVSLDALFFTLSWSLCSCNFTDYSSPSIFGFQQSLYIIYKMKGKITKTNKISTFFQKKCQTMSAKHSIIFLYYVMA